MDFWSPVFEPWRGASRRDLRELWGKLFCGGRQLAKTWAKTESAVQPLHVACFTMSQTLEEWLTSEYGADLSAVTAISGVPSDVTGKFLSPGLLRVSIYRRFLHCKPPRPSLT